MNVPVGAVNLNGFKAHLSTPKDCPKRLLYALRYNADRSLLDSNKFDTQIKRLNLNSEFPCLARRREPTEIQLTTTNRPNAAAGYYGFDDRINPGFGWKFMVHCVPPFSCCEILILLPLVCVFCWISLHWEILCWWTCQNLGNFLFISLDSFIFSINK